MTTRITGLASGYDIDSLIQSTMKTYQAKVDAKRQQKEVLEIKQKLYRDVIKEGKELYNKYFDFAKSNNLLSTSNFKSVAFSSTDETVASAKATSSAIKDTYKIDVEQVAKKAQVNLTSAELTSGDIKIENGGNSVLIKASDLRGKSEKEIAKIITNQASSIGVQAIKSDFNKGIVLETTATGSDKTIKVSTNGNIIDAHLTGESDVSNSFTLDSILNGSDDAGYEFNVNGNKILVKNSDLKNSVKSIDEKITSLQEQLGNDTLTSDDKAAINAEIDQLNSQKGKVVAETLAYKIGAKAELSEDATTINISGKNDTDVISAKKGTYVDTVYDGASSNVKTATGSDLVATVSNSRGTIVYGKTATGDQMQGESATSNTIVVDGVSINITDTGKTVLTGKTDVSETKKKIVDFVNDYNEYIKKLNKLVTERHDRDYSPLTEDQKKEMSEDEIKLWNEKVEAGQLYRDNDISRIVNDLKSAMSGFVKGAGTMLEKIGITPVGDYGGTNNGTFSIDESALEKALEEDMESVMNLFVQQPTDNTLSSSEKYNQTGIMYRMKSILNDEFMSSSKSALIQKAGYEGTASFSNNTMTIQINQYKNKISQMEDQLADKEQALYTKWAAFESAMEKYNSQMSSMQAYFGGSNS